MALTLLQKVVETEAIEYSIKEFYNNYKASNNHKLTYSTFIAVLKLFFTKFKKKVYSGTYLSTPFGGFRMKKKFDNQPKRIFKSADRLEKEHGDRNAIVYRERNFRYMVKWFRPKVMTSYEDYYFRSAQAAGREIPNYHHILDTFSVK